MFNVNATKGEGRASGSRISRAILVHSRQRDVVVVARVAPRGVGAGGHRAADAAGRHDALAPVRPDAGGVRVRRRDPGAGADVRASVGRAHEPRRDAGGGGGAAHGRTHGGRVRAGADSGRRTGRGGAGGGGAERGGGDTAGGVRAGGGAGGGADDGATGAAMLLGLEQARRQHARQVRAADRRARLRRGPGVGSVAEPGAVAGAGAVAQLLGPPLGVLGGAAVGRGAGGGAVPVAAGTARAGAAAAGGSAAEGAAGRGVTTSHVASVHTILFV